MYRCIEFFGFRICLISARLTASRKGVMEIRLEAEESVWANREERDSMLNAIERWHGGPGYDEGWES
ncbi:MAG: hypothetical protein R3B96_22170 [Pirellulaceae bacterium]